MGNATIWYWPDATGSAEVIDLGTGVSRLEELTDPAIDESESVYGDIATAHLRGRLRYRIALERFSGSTSAGQSLARALSSFQAHYDRGGTFGFSLDKDKAYAAFSEKAPNRGDTAVRLAQVYAYYASAAIAASDELIVQSANPDARREWATVGVISGASLTFGAGLIYTHTGRVFVRYRDFVPVLRRPPSAAGASILSQEQRRTYTLDLEAVEALDVVYRIADAAGGNAFTSAQGTFGATSPDELARQAVTRARSGQLGIVPTRGR
jgi:hypothetical protein